MIEQHPEFTTVISNWALAEQMFELKINQLPKKTLFVPSGLTSIGAELAQAKHEAVCADVIYGLGSFELEKRILDLMRDASLDCERRGGDPEIISLWQGVVNAFWADFQAGKNAGRYVGFSDILNLPFRDGEFDLACCAGVLIEDQTAMLNLIKELLRVAHEVRIFPELLIGENVKQNLALVLLVLQQQDFGVELHANAMLRVWSKTCVVI